MTSINGKIMGITSLADNNIGMVFADAASNDFLIYGNRPATQRILFGLCNSVVTPSASLIVTSSNVIANNLLVSNQLTVNSNLNIFGTLFASNLQSPLINGIVVTSNIQHPTSNINIVGVNVTNNAVTASTLIASNVNSSNVTVSGIINGQIFTSSIQGPSCNLVIGQTSFSNATLTTQNINASNTYTGLLDAQNVLVRGNILPSSNTTFNVGTSNSLFQNIFTQALNFGQASISVVNGCNIRFIAQSNALTRIQAAEVQFGSNWVTRVDPQSGKLSFYTESNGIQTLSSAVPGIFSSSNENISIGISSNALEKLAVLGSFSLSNQANGGKVILSATTGSNCLISGNLMVDSNIISSNASITNVATISNLNVINARALLVDSSNVIVSQLLTVSSNLTAQTASINTLNVFNTNASNLTVSGTVSSLSNLSAQQLSVINTNSSNLSVSNIIISGSLNSVTSNIRFNVQFSSNAFTSNLFVNDSCTVPGTFTVNTALASNLITTSNVTMANANINNCFVSMLRSSNLDVNLNLRSLSNLSASNMSASNATFPFATVTAFNAVDSTMTTVRVTTLSSSNVSFSNLSVSSNLATPYLTSSNVSSSNANVNSLIISTITGSNANLSNITTLSLNAQVCNASNASFSNATFATFQVNSASASNFGFSNVNVNNLIALLTTGSNATFSNANLSLLSASNINCSVASMSNASVSGLQFTTGTGNSLTVNNALSSLGTLSASNASMSNATVTTLIVPGSITTTGTANFSNVTVTGLTSLASSGIVQLNSSNAALSNLTVVSTATMNSLNVPGVATTSTINTIQATASNLTVLSNATINMLTSSNIFVPFNVFAAGDLEAKENIFVNGAMSVIASSNLTMNNVYGMDLSTIYLLQNGSAVQSCGGLSSGPVAPLFRKMGGPGNGKFLEMIGNSSLANTLLNVNMSNVPCTYTLAFSFRTPVFPNVTNDMLTLRFNGTSTLGLVMRMQPNGILDIVYQSGGTSSTASYATVANIWYYFVIVKGTDLLLGSIDVLIYEGNSDTIMQSITLTTNDNTILSTLSSISLQNSSSSIPFHVGNIHVWNSAIASSQQINTILNFIKRQTTVNASTICAASNIIIGAYSTTSSAALDVQGNVNFSGSLTRNGLAYGLPEFQTSINSNALVLLNSNFGIGCNNPIYTLEVEGTGRIGSARGGIIVGSNNVVTVTGPLNMNEFMTMNSNVNVNARLTVSSNSTFSNNLSVIGALVASNNTTINSNLTVLGNTNLQSLVAQAASTFSNSVVVNSNVVILGQLSAFGIAGFSNSVTVNSNLQVLGQCVVNSNVQVIGPVNVVGNAAFSNSVTINSNLNIVNAIAVVASSSTFSNPVIFNSNLTVRGNFGTFCNNVQVGSNLAVLGNLTTTGITTLNSNLIVSGDTIGAGMYDYQGNGMFRTTILSASLASNVDTSSTMTICTFSNYLVGKVIVASHRDPGTALPVGFYNEFNVSWITSNLPIISEITYQTGSGLLISSDWYYNSNNNSLALAVSRSNSNVACTFGYSINGRFQLPILTKSTTITGSLVTNYQCVITNSNIGIGKVFPTDALDVVGNINFTGILKQNGTSYLSSQFITSPTSNVVYILGSNIGIGTSNTSNALDVLGNINFTGNLTRNGVPFVSGGGGVQLTSSNYFGSNSYVFTTSNLVIGSNMGDATSTLTVKGDTTFDGNIKTNRSLHITGLRIGRTDPSGQPVTVTTTVTSIPGFSNTSNNTIYSLSNLQNSFLWRNSPGTTIMTLNSNGMLGIGTSNPLSTLEVATGGARLSGVSSGGWLDASIAFHRTLAGASTSTDYFVGRGGLSGTVSYANHLVLHTPPLTDAGVHVMSTGGVSRLFVNTSNGNVGIGTSNPQFSLDVVGQTRVSGILLNNTGFGGTPTQSLTGGSGSRYVMWPGGDATTTPHAMGINGGYAWMSAPAGLQVYNGLMANVLQVDSNGISTPRGISFTTNDPGDMLSRTYGGGTADRYGFGQYSGGVTRAFFSSTFAGSFAVSRATASATAFTDVFVVSGDAVQLNGVVPFVFNSGSASAPTLSTNGGAGTRLVLWPGTTGQVPYGIGIEPSAMWFSSGAGNYRFYNNVASSVTLSIDNGGNVTVPGYLNLQQRGWGSGIYFNNTYTRVYMDNVTEDMFFHVDGPRSFRWSHSGGTNRMTLNSSSDLSVLGNITAYSSDARLKTDLERVTDHAAILAGLQAYRYRWNEEGRRVLGKADSDEVELGLLAQDVRRVLPQAAPLNGVLPRGPAGEEYMTVQYEKLVPVLVEAAKDQGAQIEQLRELVAQQSVRISQLEARLAQR